MIKLLMIVVMGITCEVFAQSVTLSVDQTRIGLDDTIRLEVRMEDIGRTDDVVINGLEQFRIEGRSTSHQIQIINGNRSIINSVVYELSPLKEGIFQLGPAQATNSSEKLNSNAVRITVSTRSASQQDRDRVAEDEYVIVESEVDNKEPFVSEQITYIFRVIYRVRFADNDLRIPEFEGFWKEMIKDKEESTRIINGQRWNVAEFKFALFPLKPGPITIPAAEFMGQALIPGGGGSRSRSVFDPFFENSFFSNRGNLKRIRKKSESIELNVRAIPEANRPADFSGLVGKFLMDTKVEPRQLKLGDSATLTVRVYGPGNVHDISGPKIEFPGFKVYEDKPQKNTEVRNDKVVGIKVFKYALIPQSEEVREVPSISMNFFDPVEKVFKTMTSESYPLTVLPGERGGGGVELVGGGAKKEEQKNIIKLAEDLMPLRRKPDEYGTNWSSFTIFAALGGNFLVVVLTILGSNMVRRKRDILANDSGFLRRHRALKRLNEQLGKEKGPDVGAISSVFREFLGNRLDLDGYAVTSADVDRIMADARISETTTQQVKSIIGLLEDAQYGGAQVKMPELLGRMREAARKVDKEART